MNQHQTRFVNVPYISDLDNPIYRNSVNVLQSPCGTGKTQLIKKYVGERIAEDATCRILVLTFRRSLASKLSKDLSFESYLKHQNKRKLNFDTEFPRLVISIESLRKIMIDDGESQRFPIPDVFILDEYKSVLEHITNTATLCPNSRKLFIDIFSGCLRSETTTSILADAYVTIKRDLTALKFIVQNDYKINWIKNTFRKPPKKVVIYNKAALFFTDLYAELEDLSKAFYICSASKTALEAIEQKYRKLVYPDRVAQNLGELDVDSWGTMDTEGDRRSLISSSSSDSQKDEYSRSPDRKWAENRIMLVTPTIAAGISCDIKDHFNKAFCYTDGPVSPLCILQMIMRVRHLKDNEIWLFIKEAPTCQPNAITRNRILTEPDFILDNIQKMEQWTKAKFNLLMQNVDEVIRDGHYFVIQADRKSLLNRLIVENYKVRYLQNFEFERELKRLAKIDNYEFITKSTGRIDYMLGKFPRELKENSKRLNIDFWRNHEWNGVLSDDMLMDGGPAKQAFSFMDFWNVFGFAGKITHFLRNNEDDRSVTFRKSALGKFITDYNDGDSQIRFHRLFTLNISRIFESDMEEYQYSITSFNGAFFEASSRLLSSFGVANAIAHRIPTILGLCDTDLVKVIPLEEHQLGKLALYNEELLNTDGIWNNVREVLISKWTAIFSVVSVSACSPIIVHREIDKAQNLTQPALTLVRKIMKAIINYFGMTIFSQSPDATNRKLNVYWSNLNKHRVSFRKYPIEKLNERLMLSALRMFSKVDRMNKHYPEPDPFRLLEPEKVVVYEDNFHHLYLPPKHCSDEERAAWILDATQKLAEKSPTTLENIRRRFIDYNFKDNYFKT